MERNSGIYQDNATLGNAILIAGRDSRLPVMYLPTAPHPLWTGKGNVYVYTMFVKAKSTTPESIEIKQTSGKMNRHKGKFSPSVVQRTSCS